jgi:hypothetical protein
MLAKPQPLGFIADDKNMNTYRETETLASRFFVACIDGRQTMFVLHADKSVCIAPTTQPVTFVESTDEVIAAFRDLAA